MSIITSAHLSDNSITVNTENFLWNIPVRGPNTTLVEDAPGIYRVMTPRNTYTFTVLPNQVRIDFDRPEPPAIGRAGFDYMLPLIATSPESVQWFSRTLSNLMFLNEMQTAAIASVGA